ncbi:MAG: glycosyltransferase [Casimicrobiaceae bacterium]
MADDFSIEIVVPVYNAPDDLRRCVESVLSHDHAGCRITLIDDASTAPGVTAYFDELRGRALVDVELLANERNLGFTGTANRGMARSRADVVLLNSDTIVTEGWLDALRRCAASDPRIGTVTPFSNNAEICSFPRFCADNAWRIGDDPEPIRAALARAAVPTYPELPTGVGFCLFIRRTLIDAIGAFDLAFGLGYGEENDLCLRAARAGWRNVLADNAFVVHVGSRSFSGQKAELSSRNTAILLERHPHYTDMVERYIAADPLRALREAARSELARRAGAPRGVLHVIHDHGGGTETHVRALIDASRNRWRHYLAIAVDDAWQIEEHRTDGSVVTFDFLRPPGEPWRDFAEGLCATFGIGLVHLHNVSGCRDGLLAAMTALGLPYGYTVHDLNFACPTITFLAADGMYCGGVTDAAVCGRCLAAQPAFDTIAIEAWRARHGALVAGAAFLIAPSRWAAAMLERFFPGNDLRIIAHGTPDAAPAIAAPPAMLVLPDDGVATIAVVGAIGPDKGARRIERLVELAREQDSPLRFVLIGYMDVQQQPWQSDDARFTVHGRYVPRELPQLFAGYRVALVLYPSAGPETFSYTLSEAWSAGVPVLVPPIGALTERVSGSGAGFVMSGDEWQDERSMLRRLTALTAAASAPSLREAGARARAMPHATLAEMTDATFAVYDDVIENARLRAAARPFERSRVRDALGYVAWQPPAPRDAEAPAAPLDGGAAATGEFANGVAASGVAARIARAALAIRHTTIGRALYRMTPRPLVDALKSRLGS